MGRNLRDAKSRDHYRIAILEPILVRKLILGLMMDDESGKAAFSNQLFQSEDECR